MSSQNDYFNRLLPTHEVGSMRKLNATILALQGRKIPKNHLDEVHYWWSKLKLGDSEEFISLLLNRPDEKSVDFQHWQIEVLKSRLIFNIRFLENTGLDFVYTGEAWRREMYEHAAKEIEGIYLEKEHIRSFDDRFYKPGVRIKGPKVRRKKPIYIDEFEYAKTIARKPLRLCFTGPYTIFNWTINPSSDYQFLFDLVDDVFIPETIEAIKSGARFITSDEPAYTTIPDDREIYKEVYQRFFKGIRRYVTDNDVKIGFHTCFSDRYDILFEDLPAIPWAYGSLEYANTDLKSLGTSHNDRPSYRRGLEMYQKAYNEGSRCKLALGVLEVHANRQFSNEDLQKGVAYHQLSSLIRDRLLYQSRYLIDELGEEGIFLLMAAPDCGLRPVNRLEDLHIMLSSLVEGTNQARSILTNEFDFLPS
jgi:methionine synthase II (cobalamin-independent)